MARNRYYKGLIGQNTQAIVSAPVAYGTGTDYEDFVDSDSPEGQIAIFTADDNLRRTTALTEGLRFFFAQKRDGDTFKSNVFTYKKAETKRIAYTAPVKQVATVAFTGYTPAAGEELVVSIIETTPGNQPFPRWDYSVVAKASESLADLLGRLEDEINDKNSVINYDMPSAVVASLSSPTLTLTAADFGATFRIALQEKAYEAGTVTYTTPFKLGSGTSEDVRDLETAGNIFDGATTNYPVQNATPEEFGMPTQFTQNGKTYNIYQIDDTRSDKTPIPASIQFHNHHFAIAIPVPAQAGEPLADDPATSPEAIVKTVLGL